MTINNLVRLSQGLSPEELENYRIQLLELVAKGKRAGGLTQSEIERAIPYSVVEGEALGELFRAFEDQGIKVILNSESMLDSLETQLAREQYKWIKRSGLTERAFWIGALEALSLFHIAESQLNSISMKLVDTLWRRSGDDSFPSTNLGRLFLDLEQHVVNRETASMTFTQTTGKISDELETLRQQFSACLEDARRFNHDVAIIMRSNISNQNSGIEPSEMQKEEVSRILGKLKERLLYLSLLQTHHDLQRRFD